MRRCRECELVLWRGHESCPRCRAWRPSAGLRPPAPAAGGSGRLAVAVAVTAPAALLAADQVLRVLLA